jgi:hypothetical protein
MKISAVDVMKPYKVKRHLETVLAECVGKPPEFFHRKLNELNKRRHTFAELLLASFKIVYRIAKCKQPHFTRERLILPAVTDILVVEIMLGESYDKEL